MPYYVLKPVPPAQDLIEDIMEHKGSYKYIGWEGTKV